MSTNTLLAEQRVAERLGQIPLFRGCTLDQLEGLVAGAVLMRLAPGDGMELHGALARHVYVLLEGEVVLAGFDGGMTAVSAPAVLDDSVIFGQPAFAGLAEPSTESAILVVRVRSLERLAKESPSVAYALRDERRLRLDRSA